MLPSLVVFNLSIPTYFLWISLTLTGGLWYFRHRALQAKVSLKLALDLYLVVMICALIGSRFLHVIYEQPDYYAEDISRIFEFWNGGFVFFGGLLGCILGAVIFLKLKKVENKALIFDLAAPVASLGYSMGRLACLWAGCCFGRSCELPWAIAGRHPTQLYSSIWELGVWFILIGFEPRKRAPGQLFAVWILLHSLGRFLIEFFRDDFRGPVFVFSISGWISLGLFSSSLLYLLYRKPARLT